MFNVYNVKSRLYFHSGVFKDKQDLIDLERQVRALGKEYCHTLLFNVIQGLTIDFLGDNKECWVDLPSYLILENFLSNNGLLTGFIIIRQNWIKRYSCLADYKHDGSCFQDENKSYSPAALFLSALCCLFTSCLSLLVNRIQLWYSNNHL